MVLPGWPEIVIAAAIGVSLTVRRGIRIAGTGNKLNWTEELTRLQTLIWFLAMYFVLLKPVLWLFDQRTFWQPLPLNREAFVFYSLILINGIVTISLWGGFILTAFWSACRQGKSETVGSSDADSGVR